LPYLGGLLLLTLLAGLPLFHFKIMSGHDAHEYLPRAVEFYQGLSTGQLIPRWAPDLNAGYGEPFFNFNPPLIYYLSAIWHAMGFSFVAAQSLAILAVLLLAGLGMYLLAGNLYGSRAGLVSATAYLFAPYLLVALYVRHALADFSAFASIPTAFWGVIRFAESGRYRFLLIGALSVALLLLSSNPVALMTLAALLILVGWLAITGWREFGSRPSPILLRGLGCIGVGAGLSAFFWIPAVTEGQFVHLSRLLEGYLNYRNHFLYPQQLIISPWGFGLSLPGTQDGMSFAIGPVHLGFVFAAFVLIWRSRATPSRGGLLALFFIGLLVLAAFFASIGSLFIWERIEPLQYMEFPWRFLSLIAFSTAFLAGLPFLYLRPGQRHLASALMGSLIAGLVVFGFPRARPQAFLDVTDADYSPTAIAARNITVTAAREYQPIWVREQPEKPATERMAILSGQGRVTVNRLSVNDYEFEVEIAEAARLRVNTFYFPGWTLSVDGSESSIDHSNPKGVMEFELGPGHHLVQLSFLDTPVRRLGKAVSLLSGLLLFTAPFLQRAGRFLRRSGAHLTIS
jgi:hypothetical protein